MKRPEFIIDEVRRACVGLEMRYPDARRIMVTGVMGGEGATTVACLLGEVLAEMIGANIVMVDANLRAPALHTRMSVPMEPGLRDWEAASDEKTTHLTDDMDNVSVMPCGSDNGRTLLTLEHSGRLSKVADALARDFTYVIWDAPPLARFPDGQFLLRHVDGVLVVVESDKTHLEPLTDLNSLLASTGTPILGAIMNRSGRFSLSPRPTAKRYARRLIP